MHAECKVRPLATNVGWSVCPCVCLLDTTVSRTEMTEPIELLVGGPREPCIRTSWVPGSTREKG